MINFAVLLGLEISLFVLKTNVIRQITIKITPSYFEEVSLR